MFAGVVGDFKRLLPLFELAGIPLAGSDGSGKPTLTPDLIVFNGLEKCGHDRIDLGITWPTPDAGGVAPGQDTTSGTWFAGALLRQRTCGGDCSHESFVLERILKPGEWQKPEAGKYFEFCKTAYKPYDLAVTAALIIAQHHLGNLIVVSSDGEEQHWFDAKQLCQMELGYGMDFHLHVDVA